MSQDIKRDREIGKSSDNDLVHAVHNAIYPHLFNMNVHYSSWHIARAAVAAIPVSAESERWKDIAYNENERAGKLAKELEGVKAANSAQALKIAELEAAPALDGPDREIVARCSRLLSDLEVKAAADEKCAKAAIDSDGVHAVRDGLQSRLAAAERARHSRAFAARLREALTDLEASEYPKYWCASGGYYRVSAASAGPEIYTGGSLGWRESRFFRTEAELDNDRYSGRLAAWEIELVEGVEL